MYKFIGIYESGVVKLPESFIGYKLIQYKTFWNPFYQMCVAEVEIPKNAIVIKPHHVLKSKDTKEIITTLAINQFRTNIYKIDKIFTGDKLVTCRSWYDHNIIYKEGQIYQVDNLDTNSDNICTYGLHFLESKSDAQNFVFKKRHILDFNTKI
jgi:tRNA(Ile2) C34 agmatinyltransferase TiaS